MALEQLTQLVNAGVVAVSKDGGGYRLTGAVGSDLFLSAELEAAGAEYRGDDYGYYIANVDVEPELERLERKSKGNAAALRVRNKRIRVDGVKEFDRQQAQMIRENGDALKDVYREAITNVQNQLDEIAAISSAQMEPEEAIELTYRRGQLEGILDQLGEGLAGAGTQAENLATAQLTRAAAIGANVATWTLANVTGKELARFLGIDFAQLAVHNKYDLIAWGNITDKAKAVQMLRREVGKGVLLGEHPTKIARRIEGTFNQWRNRALTIARTETGRVMSQAAQERYAAAEAEGIDVQNVWCATLDGRTRSSHRLVDGEVRDIGEKFSNGLERPRTGAPAEAINCRCCLMPVVNGYLPAYRLDGETGEIIPWQSYKEWYEKQGKAKIEERLEREREQAKAKRAAKAKTKKTKAKKNAQIRTRYTRNELKGMNRKQLIPIAREVSRKLAKEQGITEAEALHRFDLLIDSNTTPQLRTYINKNG